MGDPRHARRPHLGLATTKPSYFALRVPLAAPILQVRLTIFLRILMLSPFTFIFFLLVLGLHLITPSCSLGVHRSPLRGVGDLANLSMPHVDGASHPTLILSGFNISRYIQWVGWFIVHSCN